MTNPAKIARNSRKITKNFANGDVYEGEGLRPWLLKAAASQLLGLRQKNWQTRLMDRYAIVTNPAA